MSTEKKWIEIKALETYPEAEKTEIEQAMQFAVEQVIRNLPEFTEAFPGCKTALEISTNQEKT